ncbi:hypothetical protein K492DRAFT_239454 [Lichtheimia hyalospora FSU 10163]|nr:hypothetical protein K492DRAFT_239454 [Lichtheimia hyalospora FSU 10163]
MVSSTVSSQTKWRYAGSQETFTQPCTADGGGGKNVPNVDQALRWTRSFFKYFNVVFPILSKHHFIHNLLTAVNDPIGDSTTNHALLLRYAVYALGSRYLCEHRTSNAWFDKCQELLCMEVSDDNGSSAGNFQLLPTVQAMVIMCWGAYLSGNLPQCTTLRRQLANHFLPRLLSSATTDGNTIVHKEMIHRALCVIYTMDQWLAICTGEQFHHDLYQRHPEQPHLEDCQLYAIDQRQLHSTTAGLTGGSESFESALQIANFNEMIKLAHILRDMHQLSPTSQQQQLHGALTEWLVHLPSYLEFGKETPIARILHMLYYTTLILLHPPSRIMAANTMVHLAEQEQESPYLYNVFGISLTLATSIHVHRIKKEGTTAQNNLDKSVRILRRSADALQITQASFDQLLESHCGTSGQVFPFDLVQQSTPPQNNNERQQVFIRDSQWFDFNSWLPPEQRQASSSSPLLSSVDQIILSSPAPPTTTTTTTPWDFILPSTTSTNNNDLASPALTLATTPAESSPASYFSISSPELLTSLSSKENHTFLPMDRNDFISTTNTSNTNFL